MSDRYTVHSHPGIVGGVYLRDNDEFSEGPPLTPDEARRLAHAILDAIGERDEAEAIVRSLARHKPVTEEEDPLGRLVDLCACCLDRLDDHTDDTCPYLRARAFVAREGREETDHG